MTKTKYIPIKKVFKHIIANQYNLKVVQYQEGYFDKIFILTDGIVFIKKVIYNNFDDDIKIKDKDEYMFGYMDIIYNPKYIKVDKYVKSIIDNKTKFYDISKHKFNGWSS